MTCECELCQLIKAFRKHSENFSEEQKEFFDILFEKYMEADMDADYYKAIVRGTWPTSEEILARYREK